MRYEHFWSVDWLILGDVHVGWILCWFWAFSDRLVWVVDDVMDFG